MLDPLIKTIEVPCSQQQAFTIFIEEMDSWWPLSRFSVSALGGGVAKSIRVEPMLGGNIMEIGGDDTEHLWGTIRSFDPHDSVSMDFHISPPGVVIHERSLVEVQFTAIEPEKTRVQLTQSNWEAFGEMAEMMRGDNAYGGAWNVIFVDAFKAACGG